MRLRHLALIVRSLDASEPVYRDVLGLAPSVRSALSGEGVYVVFVPVGDSQIELLEPTDPKGALGRYLAGRGEGIHHVALEVPDLRAAMERARRAGLRLIDAAPREGAHGTQVAFIHPSSAHGVLVELVQSPAEAAGPPRK